MKASAGLLCGILFINVASAATVEKLKRPWEGISDPLIMSSTFQRTFRNMPKSGVAKGVKRLWSSDYWALRYGNINNRWNTPRPTGYGYHSPTKEEALKMTDAQLRALAPSEKFDLFNGHYDYPLRKDVATHASPDIPLWMGICHGWAPAAVNHDEPNPITVANPDGVQVPFGSSDIKALLSYYYAYKYRAVSTHQMGRRCEDDLFGDNCKHDMNAGAFHIVLTNRVGIEGGSFIADIERKAEVWNHPITHYTTYIDEDNIEPDYNSARGTVKRVNMRTTMGYVFEIKSNNWYPVIGTRDQVVFEKRYQYYLDINSAGAVIGGDWISKDRPDFLWNVDRVPGFVGMFARLGELL